MVAARIDRVHAGGGARVSPMGRLFIAVLLVVVLEGALRKWVSPVLTNPLVLLRDSLALCGILWAVKAGTLKLSKLGAQALLLWALVVLVWGLVQVTFSGGSPIVFVVGARFWLLYLAFAYAAGLTLHERDFRAIMTALMVVTVVMAPLAIAQHYLPPSASLNKQVEGGTAGVFLVAPGVVRTTGTFSFTTGYSVFLGLATPFVLSALGPGRWRDKRRWLSVGALLALAAATIVSGSRGAIIMFAILLAAYACVSLLLTRGTTRFSSFVRLAVVVALILSLASMLPRAVAATEARFADTARSEVLSARVASMFLGENPTAYGDVPVLGHGIGAGSNAAAVAQTGHRAFLLAETETARTILEGGFLGFAFMLLKVMVIVLGLRPAFRVTRATGSPLPLLLWITTGIALLSWAMIGQLTVNAIGYLLLGLAIASLRLTARR